MTKKIADHRIGIRPIKIEDLEAIWRIAYGQKENSWMNWNGPYFKNPVYEKKEFVNKIGWELIEEEKTWILTLDNEIIGTVSYYYGDGKLARWLEVGICIYTSDYWGKGISTKALELWIDYLFDYVTELPHIGFTTWSGNIGMMRVGEKLGMVLEGRIRNVRYWQDQ